MSNTFKQPFIGKVEDALDNAVSMTWDSCHKIYICRDLATHQTMLDIGYTMTEVKDKAEALAELHKWWDCSCGLRFINAIEDKDKFNTVIGQFEYEEDEGGEQ